MSAAIDALLAERPKWASNIILAGLRGSDAHGTKLDSDDPAHVDDVDTFGVNVRHPDWYLGMECYGMPQRRLTWSPEVNEAKGPYDHLVHDLRKVFHLASQGNPNVLCWLWSDPEDVHLITPAGQIILDHRADFLSLRVFSALAGYAEAQMRKMDRKQYAGYMGAKRKALVDTHGYDVKHAAHCVRLTCMSIELATQGTMRTRRPPDEAEYLKSMKRGEIPYRLAQAKMTQKFEEARAVEAQSLLPEKVSRARMDALLLDVMEVAGQASPP